LDYKPAEKKEGTMYLSECKTTGKKAGTMYPSDCKLTVKRACPKHLNLKAEDYGCRKVGMMCVNNWKL